jgi:poly(3-hydroxybutyrate) depolymerase
MRFHHDTLIVLLAASAGLAACSSPSSSSGADGDEASAGARAADDAAQSAPSPAQDGGTTAPADLARPRADGPAAPPTSADASPAVADAVTSSVPPGAGWAGIPGIEDLSTVKPSPACGKDPGQAPGSWVHYTVTITPPPPRGVDTRDYFIKLPPSYDRAKPYRLVFEGPGCNNPGTNVIDYARPAGAEGVIQIGLAPEAELGKCFELRNDSVEYKFFDTVYAIAQDKLCFDQHRVFISGFSSGSWLSNMIGCVDGSKQIRAIAPASGGLPAAPCTNLPTPGIWTHNQDDTTNLPSGTRAAITRALKVNRCQGTFDTSPREPYMVPAAPTASMVCERFTTCPREFPIVYCHPATGGHSVPSYFGAAAWQLFMGL